MALIERFAVVGIQAQAHLITMAACDFAEPVRIGKSLAGKSHDIGLSTQKRRLGLLEAMYASTRHDRCLQAARADRGTDLLGGRQVATERPTRIRVVRGHAFIAAAAGV